MGAWGTKLYENDLTLDVRDTYIKKLKLGYSDEETYLETCKECGELDQYFWLAMADTMWKYGRLTKEVKDSAITCITDKSRRIPEYYSDDSIAKAWEETLTKLK